MDSILDLILARGWELEFVALYILSGNHSFFFVSFCFCSLESCAGYRSIGGHLGVQKKKKEGDVKHKRDVFN